MIEFRLLTKEDFNNVANLIKSEKELFWVYPGGKFPLTVMQVKELYEARKDFTVVVRNGEIIGYANLYDYLENKFVFIGNVVLSEEDRGQGIGTKLIKYMIGLAKSYNLPEVRISVFSENVDVLLLYIDLGFELYNQREQKNYLGESVILLDMKMIL